MSHSQQPAPFGQQPLLYALPYAPQPSAPQPSASPSSAPSSSAQPPKSPHSALRIAVGVACALLVLGLAAVVGNGGNGTRKARTKPAPTVTGTVTAKTAQPAKTAKTANTAKPAKAEGEKPKRATKAADKAPAPAGPHARVGQGSYLVGKDIAAGVYRTAGPVPSDVPQCSWARSKGADGEQPDSTIARGTSRGPTRVTVNNGETFETHGCKEWTQVR